MLARGQGMEPDLMSARDDVRAVEIEASNFFAIEVDLVNAVIPGVEQFD